MRGPMLMCIDPDALDTHKGRWLEIDSWLDGIVPVCTHTPPTRLPFSTTSTDFFSFAACTAARRPAGPEPMTMRSYACKTESLRGRVWRAEVNAA